MTKMDALHQKMVDETIANDPGVLSPGKMYEVSLQADPAHFLDWDKPLSEQSQHVQDALGATGQLDRWKSVDPSTVRGEHIYDSLTTRAGGDPAGAAEKLQSAGIPGIRYLDQGSRASSQGTSNYVVFNPDIIDIIRKYGIAGLIAGGGGAMAVGNGQQPQQ